MDNSIYIIVFKIIKSVIATHSFNLPCGKTCELDTECHDEICDDGGQSCMLRGFQIIEKICDTQLERLY